MAPGRGMEKETGLGNERIKEWTKGYQNMVDDRDTRCKMKRVKVG